MLKRAKALRLAQQKELENTFSKIAEEWFAKYSPALTENHANKLRRFLNKTIYPAIGDKPIVECEPADFLKVVKPAEAAGHVETAHKLLGLCGQVMSYAKIKGLVKYNVVSELLLPKPGLSLDVWPLSSMFLLLVKKIILQPCLKFEPPND